MWLAASSPSSAESGAGQALFGPISEGWKENYSFAELGSVLLSPSFTDFFPCSGVVHGISGRLHCKARMYELMLSRKFHCISVG